VGEVEYRRLPVDEWHHLRAAYEACRAVEPFPLPDPEQSVIVIGEENKALVGCVGAERTWHVSPFFVEQSLRGRGIAKRLAEEIGRFNTERLPELLVTTNRHVEVLVHNLGFIPVPGVIWRRG
jgi:GNAT superfamily N-acetyltransferase